MNSETTRLWSEIRETKESLEVANHRVDELTERLKDLESSVRERRSTLRADIQTAIKENLPPPPLTEDEHRWIQLAIKNESQSIEFRRAVIEKSLTSLVWAFIVGIGLVFKEYFSNHGFKL